MRKVIYSMKFSVLLLFLSDAPVGKLKNKEEGSLMPDVLLNFDLKLSLFDLVDCILLFQKPFFLPIFVHLFLQQNWKPNFEQEVPTFMKGKVVKH